MNTMYELRKREKQMMNMMFMSDREGAVETEVCFYKAYDKVINNQTRYCLKVWKLKAVKPHMNYYYRTSEQRDRALAIEISNLKHRQEEKAKYKKEKVSFQHDLQVGDILHSSWGYDQTNCDFYQVVALVGKKSVEIIEIGKRYIEDGGYMSGNSTPIKDNFYGESVRKLVGKYGVKISDCQRASKWDGRPCYESHYA